MAFRTVCICDDKQIGIESIYTFVDGKQINIPGKVEDLRKLGRERKLFCPCGCGNNLILVAGDKNLREQHFRILSTEGAKECTANDEGLLSIQAGENPRVIEEKLKSFVAPKDRDSADEGGDMNG